MRMIPVGRGTRLVTGAHGIRVPAARSRAIRARELDLVLLPLSAYDARGNRLGAGAGYYDRWLAPVRARARPWRIGYAFSVQQCASLPHAPWDVPLHGIISERGLYRCRRTD
jgi:5-formyltetrahydrofolate cyclo-ligase